MVGVDGLGDGVEWIISSRYNLKEYLSVCVGYTSHVFRLCLCTFVLFSWNQKVKKYSGVPIHWFKSIFFFGMIIIRLLKTNFKRICKVLYIIEKNDMAIISL